MENQQPSVQTQFIKLLLQDDPERKRMLIMVELTITIPHLVLRLMEITIPLQHNRVVMVMDFSNNY